MQGDGTFKATRSSTVKPPESFTRRPNLLLLRLAASIIGGDRKRVAAAGTSTIATSTATQKHRHVAGEDKLAWLASGQCGEGGHQAQAKRHRQLLSRLGGTQPSERYFPSTIVLVDCGETLCNGACEMTDPRECHISDIDSRVVGRRQNYQIRFPDMPYRCTDSSFAPRALESAFALRPLSSLSLSSRRPSGSSS